LNPIPLGHVQRDFNEPLVGIHRRAVDVSSALLTGGTVLSVKLAFALFLLLFLGGPAYAQSPCVGCLKATQEQLKQCLDNAISQEDKNSCGERHQAKAKVCENGECEIERDKSKIGNEVLPQKK
jgi:hypothetical protein